MDSREGYSLHRKKAGTICKQRKRKHENAPSYAGQSSPRKGKRQRNGPKESLAYRRVVFVPSDPIDLSRQYPLTRDDRRSLFDRHLKKEKIRAVCPYIGDAFPYASSLHAGRPEYISVFLHVLRRSMELGSGPGPALLALHFVQKFAHDPRSLGCGGNDGAGTHVPMELANTCLWIATKYSREFNEGGLDEGWWWDLAKHYTATPEHHRDVAVGRLIELEKSLLYRMEYRCCIYTHFDHALRALFLKAAETHGIDARTLYCDYVLHVPPDTGVSWKSAWKLRGEERRKRTNWSRDPFVLLMQTIMVVSSVVPLVPTSCDPLVVGRAIFDVCFAMLADRRLLLNPPMDDSDDCDDVSTVVSSSSSSSSDQCEEAIALVNKVIKHAIAMGILGQVCVMIAKQSPAHRDNGLHVGAFILSLFLHKIK